MKKLLVSLIAAVALLFASASPVSAAPQATNVPFYLMDYGAGCYYTMQYGTYLNTAYATGKVHGWASGSQCAVVGVSVAYVQAGVSWTVNAHYDPASLGWNNTDWRSANSGMRTPSQGTAYAATFCMKKNGTSGYTKVGASIFADTYVQGVSTLSQCWA